MDTMNTHVSNVDSLLNESSKNGNLVVINNTNIVSLDTDSGRHSMADSPCSGTILPPTTLPPPLITHDVSEFNASNNKKLNAVGTFTSKCILSSGNQITFTQKLQPKQANSFNSDDAQQKSFNFKSNQELNCLNNNINNNLIKKSRNTINLEC